MTLPNPGCGYCVSPSCPHLAEPGSQFCSAHNGVAQQWIHTPRPGHPDYVPPPARSADLRKQDEMDAIIAAEGLDR